MCVNGYVSYHYIVDSENKQALNTAYFKSRLKTNYFLIINPSGQRKLLKQVPAGIEMADPLGIYFPSVSAICPIVETFVDIRVPLVITAPLRSRTA